MGEMDAYRDIFLSESAEYIQSIVDGLLELEADPRDLEPVETVFRGAHSLKGMSATMGYEATADLTHKMEGLMETVRRRLQPPDDTVIELMLEAVDGVKTLIEAESSEGEVPDTSDLVRRLVECAEGASAPEGGAEGEQTPPAPEPEPKRRKRAKKAAQPAGGETVQRVRIRLDPECVLRSVRAYMVIKRLSHMGTVVDTIPSAREIEDEHFQDSFEVIVQTTASPDETVEAAEAVSEVAEATVLAVDAVPEEEPAQPDAPMQAEPTAPKKHVPKIGETQTVRISINHLDTMVNLVGELVILRSRLETLGRMALRDMSRLASADPDSMVTQTAMAWFSALSEPIEDLRQISGELQDEVLQTRMVPVSNIFNRFPRMVRDLARDLGKDVTFQIEGQDIELDRSVLDEVGDPIVHLLRNAIDHGIESAEERREAGKPARGTVRLAAGREQDSVQITVSDDGRGMDVERIWAKACERGLVDESERAAYNDEAILQFTCTPGFSTTDHATKVSGRGVGMDVVLGKIEYLGGSLFIRSVPGQGSEFVLTLPLTLAIIQALMVFAAGQSFAIPLGSVSEVLAPGEGRIDSVDGRPVVVLRSGVVAPLYRLPVVIGAAPADELLPHPDEHIVLLEAGNQVRALSVDALMGRHEIVIKPLGRMFKQIRGLGGATVLGDGRVALILDPRSLFLMGEQT